MTGYDLYILFLCLIVFTLLTALFSVMLSYIIRMTIKTIKHGLEDERITIEYKKAKKSNPVGDIVIKIVTTIMLVIIFLAFCFSVYVQFCNNRVTGNVPVPKVVLSDSMSYKNKANTYLKENQLDNQFETFDLIFVEKLPDEFELELFDIVVYEHQDDLIIHRIVDIEEPNEEHPDNRHFLLQGDASQFSDEYPVLYEQMRAIYKGKHIKFVGSFFAFMQSPAGYLCILLIIFAVIATPIAEKKLLQAKMQRLAEIGVIESDKNDTSKAEANQDET